MRKILIILCLLALIIGLTACKSDTADTTSSRQVVVLPESSMPSVTVSTESDTPSITVRYIGNKSSKIYHKENCTSVNKMKNENKVSFETSDEAENANYKPCGICLK